MSTHSRSVKFAILASCLLSVVYFLERLLAQVIPVSLLTAVGGLTFVGLVSAFIVTFLFGVTKWRKLSAYWMMPCLICLAGLSTPFIALPLGETFNDWQFQNHVNDYGRVVEEIRKQEIPNSTEFAEIDLKKLRTRRPEVFNIWAARCAEGAVVVYFFVRGARYQKGYLYKGCDDAPLLDARRRNERRYILRPLVGRWYHFSEVR